MRYFVPYCTSWLFVSSACGPVVDASIDRDTPADANAAEANAAEATYDFDAGIPSFVSHNPLDLTQIAHISRFRSGIGDDYSDDFEHCRNMKHYFVPFYGLDWTHAVVSAPAAGTIERLDPEEMNGFQLWLRTDLQPAFHLVLFHVSPTVQIGDHVTAGQSLGTHAGGQDEDADIAVWVFTTAGRRLVSLFDVLTDGALAQYHSFGITDRAQAIITEQQRDATPLVCAGGRFVDPGTLPNWLDKSATGPDAGNAVDGGGD